MGRYGWNAACKEGIADLHTLSYTQMPGLRIAGCRHHSPPFHSPQNDGIHLPGADEAFANPLQHAVVALIVLGAAMATAIWVPNVEFIFGG